MHGHRREALIASVESLLSGSTATVTSIGRGLLSSAQEKHNIKRSDRLLSNPHLQSETFSIYQHVALRLISVNTRPVILVDWSDLDEYKRHFLIRATMVSQGRGLCLYEEVHTIKTKEKSSTHNHFLGQLVNILPEGCCPIIVTDAGFKTPWFRAVLEQGWDFVGRSRCPNYYSLDSKRWHNIKTLYETATPRARSFSGHIARHNPFACQIVVVKQKHKGRKSLNRSGTPKRSKTSLTHQKSAHEPWVLSTSLPLSSTLATQVLNIYRLRMQIEENFRDMKSHRFGQGFEDNRTRNINRMAVLILLTTLTHWILMLLGMMTKLENQHRQFQANSIKTVNVLSLQFIGRRVVASRLYKPKIACYTEAILQLQRVDEALLGELS